MASNGGATAVSEFEALRPHLHTLPDRPTLVPYRTSYWNRTWGFCVAHDQLPVIEAAADALEG